MKVKNDHRNGNAEVTGSNPVEAYIFSGGRGCSQKNLAGLFGLLNLLPYL